MVKSRKIVDARQDGTGNISHVRFEDNERFTSVEKAIKFADRGEIENAHTVRRSNARTHLRTNPDGSNQNNLDTWAGDE